MMDINQQKEQFSRAYVHAVATVAGFTLKEHKVDDDSIDVGFAGSGGTDGDCYCSPQLDAQLKCSSRDLVGEEDVSIDLKIKNYDELRLGNFLVPRILIVVIVPNNVEEWLSQTEEQLVMRRCAWWESLRGRPKTENEYTARVHLPRTKVFNSHALRDLMQVIASGGRP
jgi:hypothetical protein